MRGSATLRAVNEAVGFIEAAQQAIAIMSDLIRQPGNEQFEITEFEMKTFVSQPLFARTIFRLKDGLIDLDLSLPESCSGWVGREELAIFIQRTTMQLGAALNLLCNLITRHFDAYMNPEYNYTAFDSSIGRDDLMTAHSANGLDHDRVMALLAD